MSNTASNPNLLDRKQAAEYLGVSVETLAKWKSSGRYSLPFVKLGNKLIRYDRRDLDKWLEERKEVQS